MLDINLIREKPDKVKSGISKKGVNPEIVDKFLEIDNEWRKVASKIDELRGRQKKLSSERDIQSAKELKLEIKRLEESKRAFENKRYILLNKIPNMPSDKALYGKDENDNKVVEIHGEKPNFGFGPLDYLSIAREKDLIDVNTAANVSGSRFGYLKNDAVLLEFALVKLAFDTLIQEGFIPVVPPVMIKPEVYRGMGRLAADQEEERYYIPKDDLYLVGSAEHTIGPMHMNYIFKPAELPRRYVGFSTCFRREAGSYGKDTKGILRVHQFDKIEMFSFSDPGLSEKEHEFLLSMQKILMNKLDLHYQVVEICTGDMGWTDARQYDIETWMPGQNKYRETHSCSNTTDFQARGINAKLQKNGKTEFVHMLNATAFAVGRMIISIIENNQTKDGGIKVPKALQEYVGKEII